MLHRISKSMSVVALALSVWGSTVTPVQAGIIPWMYDTIFGPVGSIRGQRFGANYGGGLFGGGCCNNYGPSMMGGGYCAPSCSPCGTGACGYGGLGYGYGGGFIGGGCASGTCGVNFTPEATPTTITPQRDPNAPRGTNPSPTYGGAGGTNVNPGYRDNRDFEEPTTPRPGAIPSNKKSTPAGRPGGGLKEEDGASTPGPILDLNNKVAKKSSQEPRRLAVRGAEAGSVQVVRSSLYPNSRWETTPNRQSVASK